MKKSTFTFFLLLGFIIVSAQKSPMKFGKVSKVEFEDNTFVNDTTFEAVILFDFGRTYYSQINNEGFAQVYERHCRIKINDKQGYKWGDITIPLYNERTEDLTNLEANTYNIVDGDIEKSKLKSNARYVERVYRDRVNIKFSMPNVKVGSIIEFKYKIISGRSSIRDWQFQNEIPIVWSEYNVEIPEFYKQNISFRGYETLDISENEQRQDRINYRGYKQGSNIPGFTQTIVGQNSVEFVKTCYRFVMKDVPAFKNEAYMTTKDNYLAAVNFELSSVKFPYGKLYTYSSSWESINKRLVENEWFGDQIFDGVTGRGKFLNDKIQSINNQVDSPYEKMEMAFEFIKNHMKWNEYKTKYIDVTLRKAFKEQAGNSADINLMLVLMLKKLNLDAKSVILSTRDNGIVNPTRPSRSIFNYVIAMVTIDGKNVFLDATNEDYPINYIPYSCLNGNGRIIDKSGTAWVELYSGDPLVKMSMGEFSIDSDAVFNGTIKGSLRNYAAFDFRKELKKSTNNEKFILKKEEQNSGLEVISHDFKNVTDEEKPIMTEYEVKISNQATSVGDMIYFKPMLFDELKENPFKLEERKYPVDYGYKTNESYINKFTIPDGYVVVEVPENIAFSLEGNGARFIYTTSQIGNSIQVMSKLMINKTLFLPEEYLAIKNFYNQIIAKHSEQIVLKKSEN